MTTPLTVKDVLESLYNSAWVEGSNWKENNPERGPIPSEREIRKTAKAKEKLRTLMTEIAEEVIGKREDTDNFTDLSAYKRRKILIEYELRVEQRQRLAQLVKERL